MPATADGRVLRGLARAGLVAGCLAALVGVSACSPLVTAAASMLGGMGKPSATSGGPMSGSPSAAQNGHRHDPSIREALDYSDTQSLEESCVKQLPEEATEPVTHCTLRPTCLPGAKQPHMLHICPAGALAGHNGATKQTAAAPVGKVPVSATAWRWEDTP